MTAQQNIRLLAVQGKFAQAEQLNERSQAIWEKSLGPEHPHVATSLDNRADLLIRQVGAGLEHDFKIERANSPLELAGLSESSRMILVVAIVSLRLNPL